MPVFSKVAHHRLALLVNLSPSNWALGDSIHASEFAHFCNRLGLGSCYLVGTIDSMKHRPDDVVLIETRSTSFVIEVGVALVCIIAKQAAENKQLFTIGGLKASACVMSYNIYCFYKTVRILVSW